MARFWVVLAVLAFAACAPSSADTPVAEQWRAVAVTAENVAFGAESAGRLRYRGGLELRAGDAAFGGWSGLEVLEDGRLIAVSDDGYWLDARLVLGEDETLIGFADARMALLRDENGAPFEAKRDRDAEGLARLADGRFAVSFEQTQSIRIYDLDGQGPFAAAEAGPVLEGAARLPGNAGLEALAVLADGALLVGAEGGGGRTPLWIAQRGAAAPAPVAARYDLAMGYSLTGLDATPEGDLIALERFYAPIVGARARITRFSAADLARGGVIEAERLGDIAPPMPVDNFEGIAAVRLPSGALRLYILSDDNFSPAQRTLLLAFDVREEGAAP